MQFWSRVFRGFAEPPGPALTPASGCWHGLAVSQPEEDALGSGCPWDTSLVPWCLFCCVVFWISVSRGPGAEAEGDSFQRHTFWSPEGLTLSPKADHLLLILSAARSLPHLGPSAAA